MGLIRNNGTMATRGSLLEDGAGGGSHTGPQVGALLGNGAGDGTALELALGVHNHAGVIFELDEDAVLAAPGLALANHHSGGHLLAELGLALLHGSHHHVPDTGLGKTVQAATNTVDRHDVQVLGTSVISAVHHGADWQSQRHLELVANGSTSF